VVVRDTREVRAAGLQGDALPEIIEILDDDTDAFGDRAPSHTMSDTGGPGWIGPVAALALVALVGYGVATSASSGGLPKAAPASTTIVVTPTTVPAATTTVPAAVALQPPVPYYAADPPRPYKVKFAEITQDARSSRLDYQLWATPGATGSSGSWFSIVNLSGQSTLYAQNAYRLHTDQGTFAVAHSLSGQTSVQFSNDRSSSLVFTAFGWTDEDLLHLAQSVDIDRGEPTFTDSSLIAGYQLISTIEPWLVVEGLPVEQVYYASTDDPYNGVGINVSPLEPIRDGGPAIDRQTALTFLLDHGTSFMVDGHAAVAGNWVDQSGYSLAAWTAGDHMVTVIGKVQVPQLIDIARTVHEVSSAEWQGMRFQVTKNLSEDTAQNTIINEPEPVTVSFGTDGDGAAWTIGVSMLGTGNTRQVNWTWGLNGANDVTTPDEAAQINTYVSNDRTFVLADLPRAIAATAQLQVNRAGLEPLLVPFNDIDPTLDRTFAAYAFSETGPYTAQIVGPDGAVLTSWPSS
jgi:hypothetical protein